MANYVCVLNPKVCPCHGVIILAVVNTDVINYYHTPMLLLLPDSKVHGANTAPICGRQDPGGPHVGSMNFAIWELLFLGKGEPNFPIDVYGLYQKHLHMLTWLSTAYFVFKQGLNIKSQVKARFVEFLLLLVIANYCTYIKNKISTS